MSMENFYICEFIICVVLKNVLCILFFFFLYKHLFLFPQNTWITTTQVSYEAVSSHSMLLGIEVLVVSSYQGKADGDHLHNSLCTICRYICFWFFHIYNI